MKLPSCDVEFLCRDIIVSVMLIDVLSLHSCQDVMLYFTMPMQLKLTCELRVCLFCLISACGSGGRGV
jgi:hypothetical protein